MSLFNVISPKDADWGNKVAQFKRHRIDRFILHPERWTGLSSSATITALQWKRVRFDLNGVNKIPDDQQGLYSFFAEPNIANHTYVRYLLYIGETHAQGLRTRIRSYLNEKQKTKPRIHIVEMIDRYPNHLWVYYAVVSKNRVAKVEDELLAAFLPPFNREFPAVVSKIVRAVFS